MDSHRSSVVRALSVATVLLLLLSAGQLGSTATAGTSASGRFHSQRAVPPACSSPVDFCMTGELTGGLKGTFHFVAAAVIATADSPTTGVIHFTGDTVIETKDGSLSCKEAAVVKTTGVGPMASVCTVIGGAGAFAGASGFVRSFGTFTDGTTGAGDYQAVINIP